MRKCLKSFHTPDVIEAGCDEAGRGCLAGPVFAAAVILPTDFCNAVLNDSKQLTERQRYELREVIKRKAVAWAVAECSPQEIDKLNILRCSILAMQRAVEKLKVRPQHLIIDGNRWMPYEIPADTVVKGDATYMSIAAASVLAKTYRDDRMRELAREYPQYGWDRNMGYPAKEHREAIRQFGPTPHHRMTFRLLPEEQLMLEF
jgi:ribonuclease HII